MTPTERATEYVHREIFLRARHMAPDPKLMIQGLAEMIEAAIKELKEERDHFKAELRIAREECLNLKIKLEQKNDHSRSTQKG